MDFFAVLYEGGFLGNIFYLGDFSDDMFDTGAYQTIGLTMLISGLLLMSFYYYLISNYGSFHKKRYWFIWILMIGIMNFFTAYYLSSEAIEEYYSILSKDHNYSFTEFFSFSMVNVLWVMIFSLLFSLILKYKSVRASKTPF